MSNERQAKRGSTKTKQAAVRLTVTQYNLIEERAARSGVHMTAWMRSVLLQAASKSADSGYIRIREPDGATI